MSPKRLSPKHLVAQHVTQMSSSKLLVAQTSVAQMTVECRVCRPRKHETTVWKTLQCILYSDLKDDMCTHNTATSTLH